MSNGKLRSTRFFPAIMLCVFFQSPTLLAASSTETIQLATEPGASLSSRGSPFLDCTFKKIARNFSAVLVPWARAQAGTEYGKYDGFYMAAENSKRNAYATLSEHAFNIHWLYVIKKDNNLTPAKSDFFKYKFAANHGSARIIWLNKKAKEKSITGDVTTTTDSISSLEMLNIGRIDVILENNESLKRSFDKTGINPAKFKTFIAKSKPVGVYFSHAFLKKEPDFLDKFNTNMRLCRKGE